MIYRIEESIFFRTGDGRVWTDDDTQVMLTATTSRLLAYLLLHKGNVISKDELLENVWDAYGLSTSSNSLYKYISDLRSVFKNLGCKEEIIVTVPKLGFMISKAVRVERVEDSERQGASVIEPVVELPFKFHSRRAEGSVFVKASRPGRKVTIFTLAFILLVAGIVAIYTMDDGGRQEEISWPVGNIDNFPVRSFNPHESEKSLAILKDVIATKGMQCSDNSIFFIRVSDPVLNDKTGRVFISRCNYIDDKRKKFASCENYYRADYEITR